MRNIRLAIIRQKYRSDGGAERFISRVLELLGNRGLDLNIITRSWKGTVFQSKWNLHICNPPKWGRISRDRGFAAAARTYWKHRKFDIVQSHERISGCDIFRAGDGVHRVWLEQLSRIVSPIQRLRIFLSPWHRYVLRAEEEMFHSTTLKKVICNSNMVKKDIIRCFDLPGNRITVIYNGIDLQYFQSAKEDTRYTIRKRLSIPEQAVLLIYVGSGFKRKGLKAAIEAIANSNNHYLIIVGYDKDQLRYQQLANQLNTLNRLRFMGVWEDIRPFYHASDGLLLPTLYDPFPNVIFEAMACSLPVITSTRCGGAEFITQGQQGFVCDALDIKALQEAVQMIPSKNKDPSMGKAARARISPYTQKRLVEELNALYQQILSGMPK